MTAELSAEILLEACDRGRTLDRAKYLALTDLARAEALQTGIAVARIARGERPVGYKIGFTNRSIWPLYGVFHPIWGPIWNTTVRHVGAFPSAADPSGNAPTGEVDVDCTHFAQPRLEPEIVVGLRETPRRNTPRAVFDAAEWIAHGFEIVQCPYPDWRFTAAEAIAAQSLHGALILGPRRPIASLGNDPDAAIERLGAVDFELFRDGTLVARGRGADVLDGPLHAIAHLAHEMSLRGHSIEPGAMISTGTLTDAQPLRIGQCWSSRPGELDLPGVAIRVTGAADPTPPPVLR